MNPALETHIAPAAYEIIRKMVYAHSRIHLGAEKQSLVVSRLAKRLRQLQLDSFEEYCRYLKSSDGRDELGHLVDLISTNHTYFFREPLHFDFLRSTVLPQSRAGSTRRDPFRAWSAACSSGEEPYSISIVLAEYFRSGPDSPWSVDASDISTRMLERARLGIYRAEDVRLPSMDWLRRSFQKGQGEFAGYYRVKPELQARTVFHHLNLLESRYPMPPGLDVIFCRNVMIYFDRPTQETLVQRLAEHLKAGGYLMVGLSESLLGVRHSLLSVRPGIYRLA